MKKKAATLIEVIVSIALFTIVASIGCNGYIFYQQMINEIKTDKAIYEIQNSLSYCKEYCFYNSKGAEYSIISKDYESLNILIKSNNIILVDLKIDTTVRLIREDWNSEVNYKSLYISNNGYIQPDTINLIDKEGKRFSITIRPGGNIITVNK